MVRIVELREICQRNLSDEDGETYSDELIDAWIVEAIQEYSQHFDKVTAVSITGIAAGTYVYPVTERAGTVVRVEFPTSDDPPTYLTRRDYDSDSFWLHSDSYDFLQVEGPEYGMLYLSDPERGSTAIVTVTVGFDEREADIEIPAMHHPLLIARVRWSARQFMADAEMKSPTSNSSLLMAQMEQNAKSARADYFRLLGLALFEQAGESQVVAWKMDKYDRIY